MMGPQGMPVAFGQQPMGDPMAVAPPPMQTGNPGMVEDCMDGCDGCYCQKWFAFGEFLYLRARNSEVAWAVPINDAQSGPTYFDPVFQRGTVAVADLDAQPGFRFGVGRFLDECSYIGVTYTQFDGNTNSVSSAVAPADNLRSLVSHPRAFNAASDYLDGRATYDIQFKNLDLDYHSLIAWCCDYQVGYTIGARYAELQQSFRADFTANGNEFVQTNVDFYGAGLKIGLDGERYGYNRNLFVYGKTFLSLLGGENKADYVNDSTVAPARTNTAWKAGKIVTMYDLELGAGWQNCNGNFRLSAGYMYSMYYNVVRTNEWINAVQHNNFADPSDNFNGMMSFDGFVTRVEARW